MKGIIGGGIIGAVVGPFLVHFCQFPTQVVTSERHNGGGGGEGGVSGAELANNRTDVSSELIGVIRVGLVVGH